MPDVLYDMGSGIPPEQGLRTKAMPDGSFAPVGMSLGGFTPMQSLSAVSAIGAGLILDNVGVRNNHSIVVTLTGTSTAGKVQLQGSQDNVNWINLLADPGNATQIANQATVVLPLTATSIYLGIAQLTPFRYLRAAVTVAIVGGGTVSAWVASAG